MALIMGHSRAARSRRPAVTHGGKLSAADPNLLFRQNPTPLFCCHGGFVATMARRMHVLGLLALTGNPKFGGLRSCNHHHCSNIAAGAVATVANVVAVLTGVDVFLCCICLG